MSRSLKKGFFVDFKLHRRVKEIVSAFLLFSLSSWAQQQVTQEWVQRFNGPDSLFDVGTAIDVFGSVYVTGRTVGNTGERIVTIKYSSSGVQEWASFTAGHQPVGIILDQSRNAYVTGISSTGNFLTLKYDSSGVLQWADSAVATSIPTSIALDQNNNVYVTGADNSGNRIATIKYNSSGVFQWLKTFQNNLNGSARGNDIAVDANGNVYVTGLSYNGTSFDYTTLRYDSNGNQQWVSFYNAPANGDDFANAIALDGNGNIYITGFSIGIGTGYDYATLQYNNAGAQQWVVRYNGTGNGTDIARDIAVDGFGNINITGSSAESGTQDDFTTIQYSNLGIQNWIQHHNGTANSADKANALVLDFTGNIYVTGFSTNSGTGQDYTTLKYDVNGNQQWIQLYNGPANGTDEANAIVVDSIGSVYVTGLSWGGVTNFDITTIKYNAPLSVSIIAANATCNGANNGSASAIISGGIPPYTYHWNNGQTTQNITGLVAGTYALIVSDSLNNTVSATGVITQPPLDTLTSPPACSQLFVSEYVSGTGHNTALEFFNPTNDTILLNKYFVREFMNGAPTPLIVQLVGIVLPKQTHVIANPNASPAILAKANQTSNKLNFNGDDAIQFVKMKNNINLNIDSIEGLGQNPHALFDTLQLDTLDQIGVTNVYPGNQGWTVGNSGSTKNSTLIRNRGVTSGISDNWSCGQYQWQIKLQNDISNLGVHQNICSAVNAISFSFANPIETGTSPKFFEFDIMVEANNNSTYFDNCLLRINYNTTAFGSSVVANNKVTITKGTNFNSVTYIDPNSNAIDQTTSQMGVPFGTDFNQTSWNRTLITTTPNQLLHFKIEIQNCNNNTTLQFADTSFTPLFSFYTVNANDNITASLSYDNTFYLNDLNQLLCPPPTIINFTSPVNAGTFFTGTPTTEWLLTINGVGFGAARGNGQVKFKNADDGGITYLQKLNTIDYLSWTDTQIKIKIPSLVDSLGTTPFVPKVPGSGKIRIVTNANDSIDSNTDLKIYYGILNGIPFTPPYQKLRANLMSTDTAGGYTIHLNPNISGNPGAKGCVIKAMHDWQCYTTINWHLGTDTSLASQNPDGVSVLYFGTPLNPNANAATLPDPVFCSSTNTAILRSADVVFNQNTNWFFDTTGATVPAGKFDFYAVALHELGHFHLLTHVNDINELMYYASFPNPVNRLVLFPSTAATDGAVDVVSHSLTINIAPCGGIIMIPQNTTNCTNAVDEINGNTLNINIYPNPSNGTFTIQSSKKISAIEIINILGEKIYSEKINSAQAELNISIESKGIYFYRIFSNNKISSGKLIIQ